MRIESQSGTGGAANGTGVILQHHPDGTEKSLHNFRSSDEGWGPNAAPIYVNGMLYGTTRFGGGLGYKDFGGCGTAYALTPQSSEEERVNRLVILW